MALPLRPFPNRALIFLVSRNLISQALTRRLPFVEQETLQNALEALGEILRDRDLRYEIFVIGGGSLDVVALGEGTKMVTAQPLPEDLVAAVVEVAALYGLAENWLNAGPTTLLDFGLPKGFRSRTSTRVHGGLVVHHADRFDQICFKLYATVDTDPRSKHAQDLKRLTPTPEELVDAARWSRTHDPSDGFRSQLLQVLAWLGADDVDA